MKFRYVYLACMLANAYFLHVRQNFDYAIVMMFCIILYDLDLLKERLDGAQTESTKCCEEEKS